MPVRRSVDDRSCLSPANSPVFFWWDLLKIIEMIVHCFGEKLLAGISASSFFLLWIRIGAECS